ncbi:MAG: caspase family protein, partial [Cyanobacteria bacterium J06650_10]
MANYWAITIGINQYRHLQPLMHAQNDALFMHRFFTDTVGVPADNCVLLSDLATSVGHQVVYPDKPALSAWVQTITQRVQSDDVLWFFFSGYGVQLEGADYLMPIDGDPEQVAETGLAAADLIDTLCALPTEKVLLVLDINRSQGAFSGQTISQQVIDLAQARQLPLLLSCQPEQYSHETFGVRHGLFTAALLEALQQKCTTLSEISDYVNKQLPELCDHHWRPIQNPVSLIPEAQQSTSVIPESRLVRDVVSSPVGAGAGVVGAGAATALNGVSGGGVNGAATNGAATVDDPAKATILAGSTGTLVGHDEDVAGGGSDWTPDADDGFGRQENEGTNGRDSNGRGSRDGRSRDSRSSAIVPAGKNDIVPV